MKHIVHTDDNNYIVGLELSTSDEAVEVPEEVFYSQELTCWRYENETFTFDEEKSASEETKRQNAKEVETLKEFLNSTDYIWASIQEGGRTEEYYADIIARRKEARLRIRELEE